MCNPLIACYDLPMIGTEDEALTAALIEDEREFFLHAFGRDVRSRIEPDNIHSTSLTYGDDWIHLGAGAYRSVWLSPSGVGYKVGTDRHNEREYRIFEDHQEFSDESLPVRIPKCGLFTFGDRKILAIEHIKGLPAFGRSYDAAVVELAHKMGTGDLHDHNVMVTDSGQLVIIDFGI